ncbi:pyridoxamine 5'-phosphate oxidase [Thiomicrorhabdus sp. ZW0627]|uniref:pyridoxamine 5'-phosphate oxidase n=1 Tax=Thiomicrorhabdus sp. ZW0627 TaxID=3039774 RepID=UPI002437222D|nr:pyridoxamine 5'-phosphate oxidase [Thiomicrorhabdus sp. ZW0627]MDG6774801.1 pyridoxamine 5'-phosphate oxidase [Thiomicrorhabdus sp. ZW0627]
MPNRDYHQERRDYQFAQLNRDSLKSDPFEQFSHWMEAAIEQKICDPTAMSVSSVDAEGQPHSRIVLLKAFDRNGFVFYTHYDSAKGHQFDDNDKVALLFFWPDMDRQIRIEGRIEKISAEQSEAYFQSRPRDSQLAAFISKQSQVVPDRTTLENNMMKASEQYDQQTIPHPEHWGGYRILAHNFEFWQGRPNRLHDRFRYQKVQNETEQAWSIDRLAP